MYYTTANTGKLKIFREEMEKYSIEVISLPISIDEPRSEDLREIAGRKACWGYMHIPTNRTRNVVALDSGFYLDAYTGFPGTNVNFALKTIGLKGILKLVQGENREAEFRNCLAYTEDGINTEYFESAVRGTIATEPRGQKKGWSDLDMIFEPEGMNGLTLGEFNEAQYKEWRDMRRPHSYTTKFAEWFIQKRA